jgi:ElaA protein
MLTWRFAPFDKLTPREVHDLFQARVGVFVLEQKCVFQDVDGIDPDCWHLLGYENRGQSRLSPTENSGTVPREGRAGGRLIAYCRIVPPRIKFPEPSIGRVLTTAAGRRTGAGRELMREAVARTNALWPGQAIRIGAQRYLERFYGDFGFVRSSDPYDEDGIVHIEMLRAQHEKQPV